MTSSSLEGALRVRTELGLVGAHHRERRSAELALERRASVAFDGGVGEVVDDLEIDAALGQQRERGARLAATRIVVDFGFHRSQV